MRSLTYRAIFLVATCSSLLLSGKSHAADADTEARERYERAVQLYEDGVYDAALVELRRAAELRPSYKLFYNIGQVELAMNDYAAALQAYRRYLQEGGDHVSAARRDAVLKEIDKLSQRVANVTIKADVDGADVYVDDFLVGTTPLAAPISMNAGIRRVVVRHADYLPQSKQLALTGGAHEKLSFALITSTPGGAAPKVEPSSADEKRGAASVKPPVQPVAAASAPPRESKGGEQQMGASPTWQWVGWGLTGALAIGATVTGVMALSANSELADARGTLGVSSDELHSKASDVRTLAIVTDTLIAATVVTGGFSLWMTLSSSDTPEKKLALAPRGTRAHVTLGLGLGELRLRGSF